MSKLPQKPTFLIIGAQRCATRWLRINLGHHPDVFVLAHEAEYFNDEQRVLKSSASLYMSLFRGWNGEPVVGEASPQYAMPRYEPAEVVGRITWSYPDIRCLFIIRNPYDRAFSAMLDAIRRGELPDDARMDQLDHETLTRLQLFDNSAYEWAIGAYEAVIGDQLKVLVYDDLLEDPQKFYDEALVHIGLEPGFRPPDLETPLFSSRRLRATVPLPDEDHRQSMLKFWENSTRNVERMIGRELPGWHPN